MRFPTFAEAEQLKRTWTDKFVRVKPGFPQYARFENAADHSRCTLTGVVDGAPTYSVNGGPPISLHDPIWSKNRDFVLYPLNPQPVIKIVDGSG